MSVFLPAPTLTPSPLTPGSSVYSKVVRKLAMGGFTSSVSSVYIVSEMPALEYKHPLIGISVVPVISSIPV